MGIPPGMEKGVNAEHAAQGAPWLVHGTYQSAGLGFAHFSGDIKPQLPNVVGKQGM